MEDHINVEIKYRGYFTQSVGSKEELLNVPVSLKDATKEISRYLKEDRGFKYPFTLVLNGRNTVLILKDSTDFTLKQNDVFQVVPVISGG